MPPTRCRSLRCARSLASPAPHTAVFASTALALAIVFAAPVRAEVADNVLAFAAAPLHDDDLAGLRGGFRIGAYEFNLGAVVKTVIADAAGRFLEIQSQYAIPEIGALTHLGTTVTPSAGGQPAAGASGTPAPSPAPSAAPAPAPVSAPLPVSVPAGTGFSLPGTTILHHGPFVTFIENTAVGRVITHQTDLNLAVDGLTQQALRLDAARLAGITGRGQVLSVGR